MVDQLVTLRAEAKTSMQALLSKALLQDEVAFRKRRLMRKGYTIMWLCLIYPIGSIWLQQMWEVGKLHNGHTIGLSTFFTRWNKQTRELYRPEVYAREKSIRPYEVNQFGNVSW